MIGLYNLNLLIFVELSIYNKITELLPTLSRFSIVDTLV